MRDTSTALDEHLHFLLNEVENHCIIAETFFSKTESSCYSNICARHGYLKTLVEKAKGEIKTILRGPDNPNELRHIAALDAVIDSLARIATACTATVQEGTLAKPYTHPTATESKRLIRKVRKCLDLVRRGIKQSRVRVGIKLSRRAERFQREYDQIQTKALRQRDELNGDQVRAVLLSNFGLKQTIKALTDVSEALVAVHLGQAVTLDNFYRIKDVTAGLDYSFNNLSVQRLALTRSGSSVAKITNTAKSSDNIIAVYKDGAQKKLEQELAGFAQWRAVKPSLAPRILAQSSADSGAASAILIEHFAGETLQNLLLDARESDVKAALKRLFRTLNNVWKTTKVEERANAHFMKQLRDRLPESARVHPSFFIEKQVICSFSRPGFKELVAEVAAKEHAWSPSFSVLIHGDFNVDNILYDGGEQRVRFIDLHRACYQDYIQDLSVLMVSIYRLQIIEGDARRIMMGAISEVYRFGQRFAKRNKDRFFEVRLAAGLARSFTTSTRFIRDRELAGRMHLRGRYLLESLVDLTDKKEVRYRLDLGGIFVE